MTRRVLDPTKSAHTVVDETVIIKMWYAVMMAIDGYVPYDEFLNTPLIVWELLLEEAKRNPKYKM